ncbi:hypothetical protein CC78DRAFT_598319 [Lojkania enalia]|uniref:Rhodopsin domain-containing protein n=1 Tax=Lojkania enalia TaxID=147567 RepID=A0A9P4N751_9PLEO|nr:hypothetical protein CC78DRAFT_598319 [Didymosphaeria enalia]
MTDDRGPELRATCMSFVILALISVLLRIYVRLHIVKAFGWDDAWMVVAMLSFIMFTTTAIGGVHYGTGRHMAELSDENIFMAMRYWWLCYISYCISMISVKVSIGLFLLRVTVSRVHRWIIYIAMGATAVTGSVFFFATLLQCNPISYFWDKSQPGTCLNMDVIIGLTFWYSAVSALCDFTFGLLPVFLVWRLNMDRRTKIALVPLLSMGCVASTAVLVRMAFVTKFRSPDFLYDTVDIAIWSDIEQGLAITAGSLATLRPLYRMASQRLGWSNSDTNRKPTAETPRKKPSNRPFGLSTFSRNGARSSDEEYALRNARPIQLRDDLIMDSSEEKGGKGFQSWEVQVGDDKNREELSANTGNGGITITRQMDVYQNSESEINK